MGALGHPLASWPWISSGLGTACIQLKSEPSKYSHGTRTCNLIRPPGHISALCKSVNSLLQLLWRELAGVHAVRFLDSYYIGPDGRPAGSDWVSCFVLSSALFGLTHACATVLRLNKLISLCLVWMQAVLLTLRLAGIIACIVQLCQGARVLNEIVNNSNRVFARNSNRCASNLPVSQRIKQAELSAVTAKYSEDKKVPPSASVWSECISCRISDPGS